MLALIRYSDTFYLIVPKHFYSAYMAPGYEPRGPRPPVYKLTQTFMKLYWMYFTVVTMAVN